MDRETQLWTWFLFESQLSTARAKALLARWDSEEHTLTEVLARLPKAASALGVTPQDAKTLHPPTNLPSATALRWNESAYPAGLHKLSPKLKPALMFYQGAAALLDRPIVYLWPAGLDETALPITHEVVSLLLGELVLPAALKDSAQAELLLKEACDTEGELLLFCRQGLETLALTPQEELLLDTDRLCLLSPLPSTAQPNPAWEPALRQVELAAAQRCILTVASQLKDLQAGPAKWPPTLFIGELPTGITAPKSVTVTQNPTDLLFWGKETMEGSGQNAPTLGGQDIRQPAGANPKAPGPAKGEQKPTSAPSISEDAMLTELTPDAPLAPEDALRTLEQGGDVPEVLRKRLLENG